MKVYLQYVFDLLLDLRYWDTDITQIIFYIISIAVVILPKKHY